MGLLSALNNAVSGLNVNQQQLTVLSQNVSNANTPNYSREIAHQQEEFLAGMGQGASIASITRAVNDFLNAQVRTQTSVASGASTLTDYYTQIQNLLGQPGGNSSIDQSISAFFIAAQGLANSPSASATTNVVNSGVTVARQISGLATALQQLRVQADGDISSSINTINADLVNLYKNNLAVENAAATGQNNNGLLDQRDALLNDLSQYLAINPVVQPDGTVAISSAGGITLLTNTTYGQLSHTPVPSTQSFIDNDDMTPISVTTYDSNNKALGQPTILATGGPSTSVVSSLSSGKLQSLLTMRDSIIPNILSQLDQLAAFMRNQVNAINNSGTSFPPPNSYTGTTQVTGSSLSAYSGNLRIAILNPNGTPVSSPYADELNGLQPLTLDLSKISMGQGTGVTSVDGLINAINQYFGTPQNKLEIGNINNAELGLVSNNIPDTGNTLNFDFNLNNISNSDANFYLGNVTVLDSNGATVASTGSGVTTTQPSFTITTYDTTNTASDDSVTITTTAPNGLANGDVVYLNPPAGAINGINASLLGGFFKVSNVSGNSFTITAVGSSAQVTSGGTVAGGGNFGYTKYDTVASGATVRTQETGVVTADLSGNSSSPYYTIRANIATVDANGNIVTSTVSYRVANNGSNVANNLIGADTATGSGTIVVSTTTRSLLTATLVDANGNPLTKINGVYGNQQGYLKITAANGAAVAIDQLDSKQLGLTGAAFGVAGTNQGFSQYFGLNNFFDAPASPGGDTVTNSAVNLSVQNRLVSNPSLISTGRLSLGLQPSNTSLAPNFTYVLNSGDNSVSQQLAGLAFNPVSFSAVGGLSATSTTFSQYAGQIIATTSTNSSNATNDQKSSQSLLNGFTQSAQKASGVNLDQELANTVIYQNAYSASARIISVVGTMFNELINSVSG